MSDRFWLESPISLFGSVKIFPNSSYTLEENLNIITRLVIIVSIFMYLLSYGNKNTILFFSISLLMIILGYYIKMSKSPITENYSGSKFYTSQPTNIPTNNNFISLNQSLAGPPNPKTLIKPIVIDPAYDITRRSTELNVPTGINKRTTQYLKDSGYYVKDGVAPSPVETNSETVEYYTNPVASIHKTSGHSTRHSTFPNNSYQYRTTGNPVNNVNTGCYYSPVQYQKYNAPNNVPISECDRKDPEFNERIYTQFIQPGVYNKTQVVGFPSSNIGISFQEPIYETAITNNKNGTITYTELDPKLGKQDNIIEPNPYDDEPSYSEMYDPRQNGYGSQKRSYLDPMTGQPRYFYKDVDAVRRGNFFVRSNVDHLPFAQQTGLMRDSINTDIYQAADSSYIDQNTQFRTDLQQSLMSKRNQELWQLRKYPMSRAGNKTKNLR